MKQNKSKDKECSFTEDKGTRNDIFTLTSDMQRDLYICFIGYEKASDRVKCSQQKQDLRQLGIDVKTWE